jgi:hypothetical protein
MTRAATRDASWYRRPSTHGKDLVYHVQRSEVHHSEGACGVPIVSTEGRPARDVTVDAATVLPAHRCQRPGCKSRWPEYTAGLSGPRHQAISQSTPMAFERRNR